MFNCVLLTPDEKYIRFLDDDLIEIDSVDEKGEISYIKVSYPLDEDISTDRKDFRIGNKILLYGEGVITRLYVIVESTAFDFVEEMNIEFRAEDVITELNFTPFFIQDNSTSKYIINSTNLEDWFGDYYDIGTVDTVGASDENKRVPLTGTMTKMDLLRKIEEVTGNFFKTEYEIDDNKIIRKLHFLKQSHIGVDRSDINQLIDLTYNADNIEYEIDESDTYTGISPVLSLDTSMSTSSDSVINQSQLMVVINDFLNLDIKKGTLVPMICESISGGAYPLKDEGNPSDYWRRSPGDDLYTWHTGLLHYAGTCSASHSQTTLALENYTREHAGDFFKCSTDGTYSYWNGSGVGTYACVVGDVWVCNGSSWRCVKVQNAGIASKYSQATAYWYAPFDKNEGEFYCQNINDEDIQYDKVYTKTNTDDGFKLRNYPKIGRVETSDTDAYNILNDVHNKLMDKMYPKITINISVKELEGHSTYDIFDTVYVKIPSFDKLICAQVVKIEKNPHLPSENKISISTVNSFNNTAKKECYISLANSGTEKSATSSVDLVGKLYYIDENDNEIGLSDKLINVIVTKPKTTTTTTDNQTTKVTQETPTTYYNKYGISPDKSYVCGVGKRSSVFDTIPVNQYYKGVMVNKCPYCGKATIWWSGHGGSVYDPYKNKSRSEGPNVEGHFFCSTCDMDWSIEGNEHVYRYQKNHKMSKKSLVKSNQTEATNLVNGKMVYQEGTSKTTTQTTEGTKTVEVEGWTKVYVVKTDSDGTFSKKLTLEDINDNSYSVSYQFGGDMDYDSSSSSNKVKINVKTTTTGATISTVDSSSGGSMTPISRGSSSLYSSSPSSTIQSKAIAIVGSKTGITALKAIADWVNKNIAYEDKKNFYQSPTTTLSRLKGNGCCQSELICQLAEGAGIAQQLKSNGTPLCFVYTNGSPRHVYLKIKENGNPSYIDSIMKSYVWGSHTSGYDDPSPSTYSDSTYISVYPKLPFNRSY